jgi:hypothetical protein
VINEMNTSIIVLLVSLLYVCQAYVQLKSSSKLYAKKSSLKMTSLPEISSFLQSQTIYLSDTSISEEDVIDVAGVSDTLPDPMIAVALAAVIFLGVGILQFSLGDLTKEEGQARVRDFLKTRSETERKRGYFD